jgi:hypothetical protein
MQPDATRFQIAKMLHPPRPTRLNRMQPKSKKNARRTPGFMQRVGSPRGPLGGAHAGVKSVEPKANYEAKPISPFVFIKLSKRKPNSVSRGRSGIRESRPRCPDVDAGFAKTDSEVGRAMPTEG